MRAHGGQRRFHYKEILQIPHYEATKGLGEAETSHGYHKSCHPLDRMILRYDNERRLEPTTNRY